MYAIVEISGEQFRVEQGQRLVVPHLAQDVGAALTFEKVLLHAADQVRVGAPFLAGGRVAATVVRHGRDEKVIVFKKKKRKGYRVKRGHRQQFTEIEIQSITA